MKVLLNPCKTPYLTLKRNTPVTQAGSLTIEEWMTAEEAAAYLRISVGAIRNLTSNGKLPYYKLGKRVRYLRQELKEFLLSQKRGEVYGNL